MTTRVVVTEDGSPTLYSSQFNDHYHSTHGAVQESLHVFIQAGLQPILLKREEVRILEIGLGTGLNLLLTLLHRNRATIHYSVLEPYPVSIDVLKQLDYSIWLGEDRQDFYTKLHQASWMESFELDDFFTVLKRKESILDHQLSGPFDLVYFDAFSPSVQPELWQPKVFEDIYYLTHPGGILVTYSSKGSVRRGLANAGFVVEKIPGPPGKREMLRAIRHDVS